MDEYTKIYVPLSIAEFKMLQEQARQEYRHPREQIRYILRDVLFGKQSAPDNPQSANNNSGALVAETNCAAIVS